MLLKTKESIGIYIGRTGGVGNTNDSFKVKHEKQIIKVSLPTPYGLELKKGDTIWLRYSLWDTNIGEFISKDYQFHIDNVK